MHRVFNKTTKIFTGTAYENLNSKITAHHAKQDEDIFFTEDSVIESFDIESKLHNYRKMTIIEEESQRISSIIDKADEIIYKAYPQKKQNKLFSIIAFLQDKQNLGQLLTENEELKLKEMRDINIWITAIRTIENTAIANGVVVDNISWGVI